MAHKILTSLLVRGLLSLCLLSSSFALLQANTVQVSIEGYVKNVHGFPEANAFVYIEGTFDETVTDSTGYFELSTESEMGAMIMLIAHKKDYLDAFEPITVNTAQLSVEVVFSQKIYDLDLVTVTAKKTIEKERLDFKKSSW